MIFSVISKPSKQDIDVTRQPILPTCWYSVGTWDCCYRARSGEASAHGGVGIWDSWQQYAVIVYVHALRI